MATKKTILPIYLLDAGMQFKTTRSAFVYTLYGKNDAGMYESRDKFGLPVEFHPMTKVVVM